MEITTQLLYTIDEVLLGVMIILIMLGMGASLKPDDFRAVARHYKGVLTGFMSQFGLMPLFAFGLALLLNLSPEMSIALILIGCLPGGSTSNMFTYFSRGSVALSIAMTTASTLLALIMMPILLELYSTPFAREISESARLLGDTVEFVIPTANIIQSLLVVLIPVGLGMFIRYKSPGWAKTIEDTGGFLGIIVIIYLVFTGLTRHFDVFRQTPIELYIAAAGLGLLGFLFGFWVARAFGLPPIFQRAVSLETGIQNTPVVFAIILLSFTDPVQDPMLWMAILYSIFIVTTSSFVTLFYRRIGRIDWEVYQNTVVHTRLFGNEYITQYPPGSLPKRIENDPAQGTILSQRKHHSN